MGFNDTALDFYKSVVDVTGTLNEGQKQIMELLDVQNKNLFEILLYPQTFPSTALDFAIELGMTILENLVAKFQLQTLNFPFVGFEYEKAGDYTYVKDIIKPEECTMTFYDTEASILRQYLTSWYGRIAFPDLLDQGYFFKDDQRGAKRDAIVILQGGTGLPSLGWVKVKGMRPKSISDLELGHGNTDPFTLDISFSVENIRFMTPF